MHESHSEKNHKDLVKISRAIKLSTERIVILDQESGKVFIRFVPQSLVEEDGDIIMEYFEPLLKISNSNCSYMIVNYDDFINDTTK